MTNLETPLLLSEYASGEFFDEMFGREQRVLDHYAKLKAPFTGLTAEEFSARQRPVDLAFLRQGVTFNVYGGARSACSRSTSCRASSQPRNGSFSNAG